MVCLIERIERNGMNCKDDFAESNKLGDICATLWPIRRN